jgi:hypothetical protein
MKDRRTQKNGRERGGAEGNGSGPITYTPTVKHKGKSDWQKRQDRKAKHQGWRDD